MNSENVNENEELDLENKKKKQGQMLLIMLFAIIVVVGGIIYFSTRSKKDVSKGSDLENIMPQEAKNKKTDDKEKYDKDYDRKVSDESYQSGIDNLTNEGPVFRSRSNENLTEKDYAEVKAAASISTQPSIHNTTRKASLNDINQKKIKAAQRQIAYDSNPNTPLFQKSKEELREERLAELERENNAKLAQSIISGLEKASQPSESQATNGSYDYSTQIKRKPVKNNANTNSLQPSTNQNTIARATSTGFYSESKSLEAEITQGGYIPAVVHGNGDGIVVQNGSSIKLRLLAETFINISGIKTVLPRNSLLNGLIRISDDRVNIVINSVRLENMVVPVQMIAYDIDGTQGLYIPNLMDKNLLARELTEAGARPLQGSIWTQGSATSQIGTQIATETARTLIQGTSQYARRKMNIVRVTIKPNYKILLTSGSLENTESSQSISNY